MDLSTPLCTIHPFPYTWVSMRTTIDIDDALLTEDMTLTGLGIRKATVEEALRRLVRHHRQRDALAALTGP